MKRLLALIALMLGMSALAVPAQARLAAARECSQLPQGETVDAAQARFGAQIAVPVARTPRDGAVTRAVAYMRPPLARRAALLSDRPHE